MTSTIQKKANSVIRDEIAREFNEAFAGLRRDREATKQEARGKYEKIRSDAHAKMQETFRSAEADYEVRRANLLKELAKRERDQLAA